MNKLSFQIKKCPLLLLCLIAVISCGRMAVAEDTIDSLLGASADETSQTTAPVDEKKIKELSEIPDEYLEEAMSFNEQCKQSPHLSEYYDCDCLGAKYLNKRIEYEDEISAGSIKLSIEKQCKSSTNTAGMRFKQCMGDAPVLPEVSSLESYCECFANTFAKLYGISKGKPGPKLNIAIHERAAITCRDPALASRLYPNFTKWK